MVDGLGGTTWDGALVLAGLLERLQLHRIDKEFKYVELGAGSGLLGFLARVLRRDASAGTQVVLSDRETDLAQLNTATLANSGLEGLEDVQAVQFDWSEQTVPAALFGGDLIVGAEVACLRRQQPFLTTVLAQITAATALVLISFDGGPPSPQPESRAEEELDGRLRALGFLKAVLSTAQVVWRRAEDGSEEATVLDLTARFPNDLAALGLEEALLPSDGLCAQLIADAGSYSVHHAALYYRREALATCARCHRSYLQLLGLPGCRCHRELFVCRFHPAEVRCSIDGLGDGEGYYGTGQAGYEAKFWDCCGAEDPRAPGCQLLPHCRY